MPPLCDRVNLRIPEQHAREILRDRLAKEVPNPGMAMALDICERVTHFENKQEFGRRLARPALALVYSRKDLEYSGSLYESMDPEGYKIRVHFTH